MGRLRNEFSWSFSRHRLFHACLRSYYLHHYGSWGGWEADAPPRVRERYIQKKLTTVPMWVGTRVHAAAERWVRALARGARADLAALAEQAVERGRREIEASRREAWRRAPSRVTAFDVHYHGDDLPGEAWEEALEEIREQVNALARHPIAARLARVPGRILEVEELTRIQVAGTDVWVRLDLLVEDGAGGVVIVDWKTGRAHRSEVVAEQLGVYALYVEQVHGVPPDRVQAIEANLRAVSWRAHPVDREAVEAASRLVERSAGAMRARLVEPEANRAREEDFPLLPEGDRRCRTCRFRTDCGRAG